MVKVKLVPYEWGISLLEKSPPRIRNSIESTMRIVPRGLLFGKGFQEKLDFLMTSERWKSKDLELFQLQCLKKIIDHAYRTVPYYHDAFRAHNFHPSDLSNIEKLKSLPILDKEQIRNHIIELKSINSQSYKPGVASTSGSTGKPLQFLLDQQNREIELASVWRHLSWGGVRNINARVACLRGSFATDDRTAAPKLWRWDGKLGELTFNTYDLNFKNAIKIINKLNDFRPDVIRGFPHSLFILCKLIENAKIVSRCKPKVIQTSSEHLTLNMRETIESMFGTKILDWYSQSEDVISAGQCEQGLYHQSMETGIMGIFEDQWGIERLLGTGLWNYSMPLINYEIGDCVKKGDGVCGCGKQHILLKSIEGRLNDILVTADGRAISGSGFDHYYKHTIMKGLIDIPEYFKLTQMDKETFLIDIFVREQLLESDIDHIRYTLAALLGNGITININKLDTIPDSKKWRIVESKIDFNSLYPGSER